MSATEDLLRNNQAFAASFDQGGLPASPARKLAVVACMDARLDPARVLGLALGDAHVIRNAGGVVTEDVIRSLVVSQRLLGTESIVLVHHTRCGMENLDEDALKDAIEGDTGIRPAFALESFEDASEAVRQAADRVRTDALIAPTTEVRAFLYDVDTGRLHEVDSSMSRAEPA